LGVWRRWMPAVLAGLAAAAGNAPLGWWWLALPALAGLIWAIGRMGSWRQAAVLGWCGGLGYIGGTHFWIVNPFFVDAARDGWMAPFALLFMAGGVALLWALGFGVAYRLGRQPGGRRLALAGCMGLVELLRAYLFTGFPWAPVAAIWLGLPPAQVLSLVGPYGLSGLTWAVLGLPMAVSGRRRIVAAGLAAALVSAGWIYGGARLALAVEDTGRIVRLVQPNAAQHLKWQPDMVGVFFQRQLDLTAAKAAQKPDLVIWPETALAWALNQSGDALAMMRNAAGGVPVVFGAQREEAGRYFNSLAVLDGDGRLAAVYDKHHLVPFGEYLPLTGLAERLGLGALAALAGPGYTAGPGPRLIDMGALGRMLPLICYEAVFARDVAMAPRRADWIAQITNDAWFGQSAMPYQHLDQARLRAIEQGLPVLRAANTGISAVIDAQGRVVASLPLGQAGYLDAALPGALPASVYARIGQWPVTLILIVFLAAIALWPIDARVRPS